MSTENTCPQCKATLPPDAPAGLCPRCLLRSAAGLGEVLPEVDFPDIGDPADVGRRLPQFEIIELLGQGGMGVVYKARQPALDRIVALKILPPADAMSPDFVERFRREARALAKLSHPNIVAVFECGEQGGLYYFVMEYVDGANLRALLESKKFTAAEALAIVPHLCDALEYAHEEGVIHRDIKPENLLIDKRGRVKIADFGLAKLLRREALDVSLTISGTALGTLRYMAPEQMEKPETVDHRADIYSLGVVIYEMLTGEVPMGHFAPPSGTAGVDARLDKIVLHALERDVTRRYQHASEIKTDVENVTSKPAAEPISSSAPTQPPFEPCFSRHAILGAVWAMLGLPAGFLVFAAFSMTWTVQIVPGAIPQAEHAPTWVVLVTIPLAIIALSAPFGTTILGAVGIGQIKRSGGKLVGLPLAVADVLFFPLLVLGTVAAGLTHLAQIAFWTKAHTGYVYESGRAVNIIAPSPGAYPSGSFIVLDVLVALIVCFFVARATWRAVSGTDPARAAKGGAPGAESGGGTWRLVISVAGLAACAFPCTMMTSGFWGMQWWSSASTGVGAMSVAAGSPAAKAGIIENDHIKEVNGTPMTHGDTLKETWKQLPVGTPVEIKIKRGETSLTLHTIREPDTLAGRFYWNWQGLAGITFLLFGALLAIARSRPALASGFSLIVGVGALVLLACVAPAVEISMVGRSIFSAGPSQWKNDAFMQGAFQEWPWQKVVVVVSCGLLFVTSLRQARRADVSPDMVLGGVGLLAFALSLAWGICRLSGAFTNFHWAAVPLTLLSAIGVAILFPKARSGEPGSMRAMTPEIVLVLLGAGAGALPWTQTLFPVPGWMFWHGGIFSMVYFALGLAVLIGGGSRVAPWMGVVTILAALGGFASAFAFTQWPPEWHLFTDGTGTAKATHLLPGVFVAYALSVLTAAMGALQLREALKAGKKQA